MPKTRAPYPAEYRQQILALAQAGRTPQELAKEFEPTEQTIRTWIKQAEIDAGERQDGPTTDEKRELARFVFDNLRSRQLAGKGS